jgi:hypothetical protein
MPTLRFDNEKDLLDSIRRNMLPVINKVGTEIKQSIKQNVEDIVYDPWEQYVRKYRRRGESGGFLGSWDNLDVSGDEPRKVSSLVFSNPQLMSHNREGLIGASDDILLTMEDAFDNPDDFANPFNVPDRRSIMDRAIAEGTDWDFFVPLDLSPYESDPPENWWTHPRDYWTPSIDYVNRNFQGFVDYYIAQAFDMKW